MTRHLGLLILILAVAALVPPAMGPVESSLRAQSPAAQQEGPAVRRAKRNYAQRVAAVFKTCNLVDREKLLIEMFNDIDILSDQFELYKEKSSDSKEEKDRKAKRRQDIEAGVRVLEDFSGDLVNECDFSVLSRKVIELKIACRDKEAAERLTQLGRIVKLHEERADAANKDAAKKKDAKSEAWRKEAQAQLRRAQKAYNDASDFDPDQGSICNEGGSDELPGMSGPPTEFPAAEEDADFGADRLFQISENSSWLLGDWVYNAWNGGQTNSVLRFRLESDGTISGYLVSVTNEMAQKGYSPGMQILRGIRDTSHTIRRPGNIWSHSADGGETYSPKDPNRRPGQIYGQAEWFDSGVIFVDKETMQLGGSTGFQNNRLNWHRGTLSRPNLTALQQAVREISGQVERLSRPGNEFERLEELPGIIERLEESGRYSREAREAAQIMRLLLERENLINDPLFREALNSLEDGEIGIEDFGEFANAIVGRSALLGQAVVNNTYDDDIASHMFLHGVNGARIHRSMESQPERYSQSTRDQLAQHLATLRNAAGSAGSPSTDTAGQLMSGLRDLSTLPVARPGPLSLIDLPAHTAAAVLEQTKAGFGHGTNAIKGVVAAIAQGDTSAFRSATPSMRALDATVSGPGYVDAVKRSITDRIIRYVPFAPEIASWFE